MGRIVDGRATSGWTKSYRENSRDPVGKVPQRTTRVQEGRRVQVQVQEFSWFELRRSEVSVDPPTPPQGPP